MVNIAVSNLAVGNQAEFLDARICEMLLPDTPQDSPDNAGSVAILAKLEETLAELDELGCDLAAVHVSMAIHVLKKSEND